MLALVTYLSPNNSVKNWGLIKDTAFINYPDSKESFLYNKRILSEICSDNKPFCTHERGSHYSDKF